MGDVEAPARDWSEAVSEASRHVEERLDAQAVVEENRGPVSRRALISAATVLLLVLVAANIWLLVQPARAADTMFYARENQAWTLADAADVVEDFRLEAGRLPTPDEVAEDFAGVITYELRGGQYVLTLYGEGPRLTYDSSVPLEDWLAATVGGGQG